MENPIHLYAESFIQALQGKVVRDKNGKSWNFLMKKYEDRKDVVVIWNVLITEKVDIGFQEIIDFNYGIVIHQSSFEDWFTIYKGNFKENFIIQSGDFKGFQINGGIFEKPFSIINGIFEPFNITGGIFKDLFSIFDGIFESFFTINNACFESNFKIKEGNFNYVYFSNTNFNKILTISGGIYKNKFVFEEGIIINYLLLFGGEFHNAFQIEKSNITNFSVEGGFFHYEIYLGWDTFFEQIDIKKGTFHSPLLVDGAIVNNFFLATNVKVIFRESHKKGFINKLILTANFSETILDIEPKARLNNLFFKKQINADGEVSIYSKDFNKVCFENFINKGVLELTSIQARNTKYELDEKGEVVEKPNPSQLKIINSNLDNAIFKGVQFDSFDEIRVKNSKLNNISTIDSHFPTNTKKIYTDIDDKGQAVKESKRMAEIYNQLYLAMQKQGNRKEELAYYAEYLSWQKKAYYESKNYVAWLSLKLHQLSTNFGNSWLRGVMITFLGTIFFYFLFSLSQSIIEGKLGLEYLTLEHFSRHVRNLTIFFNPVHRLEQLSQTPVNGLSALIDFIGRIFIGYMIYQTVTAFRRFGRK